MKSLDQLQIGQKAYILPFELFPTYCKENHRIDWEVLRCRLLEMGISEGSLIQVAYKAPFKNSPVAVYVSGDQLISIGAEESCCVFVDLIKGL